MEKLINGIVIMNHKNRLQEGMVLKKIIERQAEPKGIEVKISTDYTDYYQKRETWKKGLVDNFINCLKTEFGNEGKYRIIIQDDVLVPPRALDNMEIVLKEAPEKNIVGLYNPSNRGYEKAEELGHHVMSTRANIWPQCLAWPNKQIGEFIEWSEKNVELGKEGADWLMSVYSHYTNTRILVAIPSIVQHLGRNRSTLGFPGVISGRKRCSENYDPDFNFASVDWKKEFEKPYKDSITITSGKGLRVFKGEDIF